MKKVNFELLIRDKIYGFVRPIFLIPSNNWECWSIKGIGNFYDISNCEKELIDCREFFSKKNSSSFERKNTARSIVKMVNCIDYKNMTMGQFEKEFLKIVDQFVNLIDEFCSGLKMIV